MFFKDIFQPYFMLSDIWEKVFHAFSTMQHFNRMNFVGNVLKTLHNSFDNKDHL